MLQCFPTGTFNTPVLYNISMATFQLLQLIHLFRQFCYIIEARARIKNLIFHSWSKGPQVGRYSNETSAMEMRLYITASLSSTDHPIVPPSLFRSKALETQMPDYPSVIDDKSETYVHHIY